MSMDQEPLDPRLEDRLRLIEAEVRGRMSSGFWTVQRILFLVVPLAVLLVLVAAGWIWSSRRAALERTDQTSTIPNGKVAK